MATIVKEESRVKLNVPAQREETPFLAQVTHLLGTHLGLGPEYSFELELAVTEAANNSIVHACEENPSLSIELEIVKSPSQITILLRDHGTPLRDFAPPPCPVPDNPSIEALPTRGFGLFLIHQVMDEVHYSSARGTNTMTLIKFLPPAQKSNAPLAST